MGGQCKGCYRRRSNAFLGNGSGGRSPTDICGDRILSSEKLCRRKFNSRQINDFQIEAGQRFFNWRRRRRCLLFLTKFYNSPMTSFLLSPLKWHRRPRLLLLKRPCLRVLSVSDVGHRFTPVVYGFRVVSWGVQTTARKSDMYRIAFKLVDSKEIHSAYWWIFSSHVRIVPISYFIKWNKYLIMKWNYSLQLWLEERIEASAEFVVLTARKEGDLCLYAFGISNAKTTSDPVVVSLLANGLRVTLRGLIFLTL